MIAQAQNYFQTTYSSFLSKKILQTLNGNAIDLMKVINQVQLSIFEVFKDKIKRVKFLKVQLQIINALYIKQFLDQLTSKNTYIKSSSTCLRKLTFLLVIQRIMDQLDTLSQKQLQITNKETQIISLINHYQLLCQFEYLGCFKDNITLLIKQLFTISIVDIFSNKVQKIFKKTNIDYKQLFIFNKKILSKQAQKQTINKQENIDKKNQTPKKKINIKFEDQTLSRNMSTPNNDSMKFKDFTAHKFFTVNQKIYPGRTIYMSHPMKYRKKQKEKIQKQYYYVEKEQI